MSGYAVTKHVWTAAVVLQAERMRQAMVRATEPRLCSVSDLRCRSLSNEGSRYDNRGHWAPDSKHRRCMVTSRETLLQISGSYTMLPWISIPPIGPEEAR